MSLKELELKHNLELKQYTGIKIGGKAKYFFLASGLDELCRIAQDCAYSFYLLGRGSNLLVSDQQIEKPVVKLTGDFKQIKSFDTTLEVGSAVSLACLLKYCLKNNLGGLENLAGIPASLGGLLRMNASSFGWSISSVLDQVEVLDKNREIKTLKKEQIKFGYRFSSLKDCIILKLRLLLTEDKKLKNKIGKNLKQRLATQDYTYPSCGCIFKNHPSFSAGLLIDSCGLKGQRRGGALISNKHANFILNLRSASYKDVDYLIQKIKEKVYKKYSIILEEEIIRWT